MGTSIAILGGGNIGLSMARGLVKSGKYQPADITITRRHTAPLAELAELQRPLVERAQAVIQELRRVKDRLSLAALITKTLDLTAYDASLVPEFLGRRKLANLRKLVEMHPQPYESHAAEIIVEMDRVRVLLGIECTPDVKIEVYFGKLD